MEKEGELGGILKSEQAIPFKYEMYQLSRTFADQCRRAGVEIRLNTEATKEAVEKENPDALIIAAGSQPLVPPIEGIHGDNVVIVNQYYLEKDKVQDEVVVLGGGLAGCEASIHLAREGKKVTVVEMRDELAPDANVRHRPLLLQEMESLENLKIRTGLRGVRITDAGIVCQDKEGQEVTVPGKTVICALGQRARTDVVEALQDCAPYVCVIGDCAKVGTITNAVYQGYHAALDIR